MFASSLALALLPFVSAAVHDIQVGGNGKLEFSPEAIAAQPGDQVVFHFMSKNHTATQSSLANPCGPKDGGFDSGFQPVAANQTDNFPVWTYTVPDTQPVWVYCRQKTPANHCATGMVFAINCGTDGAPNSFTNFKQAAINTASAPSSDPYGAPAGGNGSSPPATAGGYGGYGSTTDPASSGSGSTAAPATPGSGSTTDPASTGSAGGVAAPATAAGTVHKVVVGGPGTLAFNPPSIQAQPGDTVVFEFHQKNHTVTQSSFATPCAPLNANGATGFDSGFQAVADGVTTFPTWNFTVKDTTPVWAYCRQPNPTAHCGAGMVFAINSVDSSDKSYAAFQEKAKATASNAPNSASTFRLGTGAVTVALAVGFALFF